MTQELLKTAADTIEAQQAKIAELEAALQKKTDEHTQLVNQVTNAKEASEKAEQLEKEAAAKIAPLAKKAADRLHERGMFSSDERRDQFAANIMHHAVALEALAKTADYVNTAPKVGRVVVQDNVNPTADDVWNQKVLNKLGGNR